MPYRTHTILGAMTPFPNHIDHDAGLDEAEAMMEAHGFHHLPVKRGDTLLGVVAARDLTSARLAAERSGATLPEVGEICPPGCLLVDVSRSLPSALREMAERHVDAALVTRDEHLAGILTTTDACRLLADLLDPTVDDEIA